MVLNSKSIGSKIAVARKKTNLSQAELAQQVSISPQAVGKWERGESMPDIFTLNRLAEIFGVDLNYFSGSFQESEIQANTIESLDNTTDETKINNPRKRPDRNWDMSQGIWTDADFSGLKDLKDKFSSSDIKNCKFINSDLSGLTLKANNISICDFSNADLKNSKIQSSEISKSIFSECNLIDTEITQSEIISCNFNKANFSGMTMVKCNFDKNTIIDAVFKHTSFKNVDISEITFNGTMEDCSFEICSFKKVKFQNATITNSFFKHNRKFNRVEFINCKVDKLTYAFLKSNGAKLEGVSIIE